MKFLTPHFQAPFNVMQALQLLLKPGPRPWLRAPWKEKKKLSHADVAKILKTSLYNI